MAIRFTTPTEEFIINGVDLTACDVTVNLSQGMHKLELKPIAVTYDGINTHVFVVLTQEQSGRFWKGIVKVQINWITVDGDRDATLEAELRWHDNLLDRVIQNA